MMNCIDCLCGSSRSVTRGQCDAGGNKVYTVIPLHRWASPLCGGYQLILLGDRGICVCEQLCESGTYGRGFCGIALWWLGGCMMKSFIVKEEFAGLPASQYTFRQLRGRWLMFRLTQLHVALFIHHFSKFTARGGYGLTFALWLIA